MRTINYAGYRMVRGFRSIIYKSNGEIHYISGTDVLPVPLEGEEEKNAIAMLATEAEREHGHNTGAGMEDLISIGTIGLIKAINSYNPDKNIKLATYASRCIENEILMYLRRSSKLKMEVSIDEPLNVDWDGNELLLSDILGTDENVIYNKMEEEVNYHLLYKALAKLSPREKTIIQLRFGIRTADGEEKTQKEVADFLGISQSYISRLEKKIIGRLKKDIVRMEGV